jgi:Trk-type K+ transport system membrane component
MKFREGVQQIREYINLRLFNSKETVLNVLTWLTLLIAMFSLLAIIYYYGFPQNEKSVGIIYWIIRVSIWFYILKYLVRIFYDFHPGQFIRENRMDSIIFILLVLEEVFYLIYREDILNRLFGDLINLRVGDLSILAVQLYFFLIVGLELGRAAVKLSRLRIPPARLFALSFLMLISFGALMLMLPEMTTHGISFMNSLFTSTSAVCVTGLTVVDTATAFTHKGHWIIMLLIQAGGINILAFAAFFAIFYKDSSSIKYQSLIKDLLDTSEMSKSRSVLGKIVLFSFVIELTGMVILYLSWGRNAVFPEGQTKLFSSVFHTISAFNNAGFSLFTKNFFDDSVRLNWGVHGIIALLVFLGGIGYPVLQDLAGLPKKGMRSLAFWRYLQPGSRVALRTSVYLIVIGAVMFYLFYPAYPTDVSVGGRMIQGVFHSVIARTAGFNTVDIGLFSQSLILVYIFLMYIGASPGSTGGGIKTTTFAVIIKSIYASIRGNRNLIFFQHTLRENLVQRAVSVAVLYACFFLVGTIGLTIVEPGISMGSLAFEQVSALSTVGLSTGITPTLGIAAKIILTLSMFIGRIGSLTIMVALIRKVPPVQFTFSHTNIPIG